MRPHAWIGSLAAAALYAGVAATPAAAQIYGWVDSDGRTVYSDALPSDLTSVTKIEVVGETALSAQEQRTLEIINESLRARASAAPGAGEETLEALPEVLVHVAAQGATETVRDPCLLSPDPRCHEKHAADYHPYHGYAPSLMGTAHGAAAPEAGVAHVESDLRAR